MDSIELTWQLLDTGLIEDHQSWNARPIAFSADGRLAVIPFIDHTRGIMHILLKDAESGKTIHCLAEKIAKSSEIGLWGWPGFSFSPDSRRVVFWQANKFWVCDVISGSEIKPLSSLKAAAMHSVYKFADSVLSRVAKSDWENALQSRAIKTRYRAAVFSPDGRYIFLSSNDGMIQFFAVDGSFPLQTWMSSSEYSLDHYGLAVSPSGKVLAAPSTRFIKKNDCTDYIIQLWIFDPGRKFAVLKGHDAPLLFVGFSPDGQRLASADIKGTVKVWELPSGRELRTLSGHASWVHSVTVLPVGQLALVDGDDKDPGLWD
ncbi:hypothetical protein JMJ55_29125 [Belnapia sp. T6]|uniref:WD40 repeat domain-containing protein n=1 Tax=Belnapia mucosa TaxID=2804532 RepID=A0ABS1VG34_9PROT|nr:hypothetical protein [Belnapia mucosa]